MDSSTLDHASPDRPRASITSRVLDAPRDEVFRAFADSSLLSRWWGPEGFRTTFEEFEFRAGGDWRFVMHGPDGRDYPNRCLFVHVNPPERIVFEHLTEPRFETTIRLHEQDGRTRLEWTQLFDTIAEYECVRAIVDPANEQTLDRLEALLAGGS